MDERLIKIDENTYRLEDGFVRCFLLIGDEKALWIDSGVSGLDIQSIAKEVTGLPQMLLNTHGDGDHVAGNGAFSTFFIHAADYENNGLADRFPKSTYISINEGDVIELGNRSLTVWEIPGHTKGSVAIYDSKYRRVVVGDSVQDSTIFMFGNHRAPELYGTSLSKLIARKEKFDIVLASHGEPELPFDYIEKVKKCWEQVLAGKVTCSKENLFGNKVLKYQMDVCGFYCGVDEPLLELKDDEIFLNITRTCDANPEKEWVLAYYFDICLHDGTRIGKCDLRFGHNTNLYYGGNIGYEVEEKYQGHHYATKACKILFKLAKKKKLDYVYVTCDVSNDASARTCELAGGKLVAVEKLPEGNDMYERGMREVKVFRFDFGI